jgi:hypothetical protein
MNFFDHRHKIKQLLILDEKERWTKPPADMHWKGAMSSARNDHDNVHKLSVAWGVKVVSLTSLKKGIRSAP